MALQKKIKDQIIAYIHTTLDMVEGDREAVWDAAIELVSTTQSIDEFKANLSKEISEELEPLIDFLKNPAKNFAIEVNELDETKQFILQTIGTHANNIKQSPSKELPDKTSEEIAAQQMEKIQSQVAVGQTNGKNPNNVDNATPFELQQDREQFYNTPEGRGYLRQRAAIVNYVPRSVNPGNFYLVHSILADYSAQSFFHQVQIASPLSPQYLRVITGVQTSFSNFNNVVGRYNLDAVFAFMGYVLSTQPSHVHTALNTWQFLQITSEFFGNQFRRELTAPRIEQRAEEVIEEAEVQTQPHSFYESFTNADRSVSNQAYELWESTVGVSVTSNISSMWSRARQQVTRMLAQNQNPAPAPENTGRVRHV